VILRIVIARHQRPVGMESRERWRKMIENNILYGQLYNLILFRANSG
jgi:hypothetical protein